ncbi:hypothetical protein BW731_03510 [Vagococcus martis]|uniref:Nudix hydrolase domain-containing protein n=1 Tax=Vagococcus martis TaxID=1768210 RepID=A0A1V4DFK5_9ENTE|nr:NUDIX domain-containing protein [Vagococcus martis]OPF87339.1 hypothetical protein BW731_03510 [Vagococcus martis]
MKVKTYDLGEISDDQLVIAMIVARHKGKNVYVRHKDRTTFEIPGGHRELNEPIEECAKRELMEETVATTFVLNPLFILGVERDGIEDYGQVYSAEIEGFSDKLEHEIEEVIFIEDEPEENTYPAIQSTIKNRLSRKEL